MRAILAAIGGSTRRSAAAVGGVSRLTGSLLSRALRPRANPLLLAKITVNQIRFSGIQAVPLVAVIAALVGAISIVQSFDRLTGMAPDLIGPLLATVIVRDLGPLVTSVILIGRSGTAIAAELASMRLNGELDALRAFRIDPVEFVVLPRVVGLAVSLFCLIIFFDVMGIMGGFGIAKLVSGISFALVRHRVMGALQNRDAVFTVLKALLFGPTIALISCYFGLSARAPTDLPQAVTKAAVAAMASVVLLDAAVVTVFYLFT